MFPFGGGVDVSLVSDVIVNKSVVDVSFDNYVPVNVVNLTKDISRYLTELIRIWTIGKFFDYVF